MTPLNKNIDRSWIGEDEISEIDESDKLWAPADNSL